MLFISMLATYAISVGLGTAIAQAAPIGARPRDSTQAPTPRQITRGRQGDETSAILDGIIVTARQSGSMVIVISRLGDGEYSVTLNRRRLHNAVARLIWY